MDAVYLPSNQTDQANGTIVAYCHIAIEALSQIVPAYENVASGLVEDTVLTRNVHVDSDRMIETLRTLYFNLTGVEYGT